MELEINVIDAFTDSVFKGNPAAVIITDGWLSDKLMQLIALENNLSETAFLVKSDDGSYKIRWFSPITEIAFCGHATLASAFVLFEQSPEVKFITFLAKSVGELSVVKTESGYIQMNFPNTNPKRVDVIPSALKTGLSVNPVEVYKNDQAFFVVYPFESDVFEVARDNEILRKLAPYDVVVTSESTSDGHDFISRYFWPANGGDEDPVTGSIHTGLAPLWSNRLNKKELIAYQASRRGGILNCIVQGDRVLISGKAVQYLKGSIRV